MELNISTWSNVCWVLVWICEWIFLHYVLILRGIEEVMWLMAIKLFLCVFDLWDWWTQQLFMLADEKNSVFSTGKLLISELRLIGRKFSSWSTMRWWLPASRNWPDITDCCFYCFFLLSDLFLSAHNYVLFRICLPKDQVFVFFTF